MSTNGQLNASCTDSSSQGPVNTVKIVQLFS